MSEQIIDITPHEGVSRRHLLRALLPTSRYEPITTDDTVTPIDYPAAPPVPESEIVGKESRWQDIKVNRRPILGGLALFAVGCNQVARNYLNNHWESIPPSLTFLGGEVPKNAKQIALFLPGFGDLHAERESQQIVDGGHWPADIPMGFFSESFDDASIEEKADLVREQVDVDKLESIMLIGRSMGGQDAWALAAELGVPVSKIIMFSSPFGLKNGSYGNWAEYLQYVPDDRETGFVGKLVYSWLQAKEKNGYGDVFSNINYAWNNALAGDDPKVMQKRGKVSLKTNLASHQMIKKLEKVIIPNYTKVYYTESDKPGTDHTVHDTESEEDYREECHVLGGVKFFRIKARYHGHADVGATVKVLKPIFNEPSTKPPKVVLADGPR